MNVIIYGAGITGRKVYNELENREEGRGEKSANILAFVDGEPNLWNTELFGKKIISPNEIKNYDYDKIIVAIMTSYREVAEKLERELGVPKEKIDTNYSTMSTTNRNKFLLYFAKIVYDKNMLGSVAEGGVFTGEFAKQINQIFHDRTIYLFDTFDGFDERDVAFEQKMGFSGPVGGYFKMTSEEKVMSVLPYPEKAIMRKGYFPGTVEGIDDKFVFVNLDFDLYNPTLAGLEFFYPKMVHNGVILIHDFFNDTYKGVKVAVDEFCKKNRIAYIPIADEISVAIVKH